MRTTKAQRIIFAANAGFHIVLYGKQGVGKAKACQLLKSYYAGAVKNCVTQLFLSCNDVPECLASDIDCVAYEFKTSDYLLLKKELGKMVHNVQ